MLQNAADAEDAGIGPVLPLPAVLDLRAAAPLAAMLLARRGAALALDAAGVERLGGLCLQVLLAAATSWRQDARTLRIENPSAEFAAAAALFGAGRHLGCPEAAG